MRSFAIKILSRCLLLYHGTKQKHLRKLAIYRKILGAFSVTERDLPTAHIDEDAESADPEQEVPGDRPLRKKELVGLAIKSILKRKKMGRGAPR